jgi:myo-inositol-1(or 4)-monophosphatase
MTDLPSRTEFAVDLARRAGVLALTYFGRLETLTIESKGHQDLVSEADREVELFVRAEIEAAYPEDGIVGEEHAPKRGTSGFDWVIDPIDGTANFVTGIPQWCVIIACAKNGGAVLGVIHEPMSNETFHGHRGGGAFLNGRPIRTSSSKSLAEGATGVGFNNRTRAKNIVPVVDDLISRGGIFFRNASGGLMLSYLAAGRLIGYVEEHMNAWDCIGGLLLVEEAGGKIVTPDADTVLAKGTVVIAGCTGVFDDLVKLVEGRFGVS